MVCIFAMRLCKQEITGGDMVKKRQILLLCLCFSVLMLAGCAQGRNLSEEQQDLVAEYSAGVLLQHEDSYERRLLKQEELAETAQPTVTASSTPKSTPSHAPDRGSASGEEETVKEISLNTLYGVPGMDVTYQSYTICREYPKKNSVFQLTAKKGERLLVVKYKVKNTTSKSLKVNLINRQIGYTMNLDGTEYEPTIAIQKNGGLNYLKTTIKPHSSQQAIVVYSIPKASSNPEHIVVTVKDKDHIHTLNIK